MIIYNTKESFKNQINKDFEELEIYKNSYNKKIELYNIYLNSMNLLEDSKIKNQLNVFNTQIQKIDRNLKILTDFKEMNDTLEEPNIEKNKIKKYNKKYNEIKNNFISNSIFEESIMLDYIETQAKTQQYASNEKTDVEKNIEETKKIENNDTLLISEIQNKVILPYTSKEIEEILNDEKNYYETADEVIENIFTRPISTYKSQFISRYNETMKLATERDNCNLTEAIALSIELMGKRYLYPAIISACRNLDELDVYLDCLEKNELDDFKIFKIKYELHPLVIKQENDLFIKTNYWTRMKDFFRKIIFKNYKTKVGKRYKN